MKSHDGNTMNPPRNVGLRFGVKSLIPGYIRSTYNLRVKEVIESVSVMEAVDNTLMTGTTSVTCTHCGYEWQYSGNLKMATCPSCSGKTPVESEDPEEPAEESEVNA